MSAGRVDTPVHSRPGSRPIREVYGDEWRAYVRLRTYARGTHGKNTHYPDACRRIESIWHTYRGITKLTDGRERDRFMYSLARSRQRHMREIERAARQA